MRGICLSICTRCVHLCVWPCLCVCLPVPTQTCARVCMFLCLVHCHGCVSACVCSALCKYTCACVHRDVPLSHAHACKCVGVHICVHSAHSIPLACALCVCTAACLFVCLCVCLHACVGSSEARLRPQGQGQLGASPGSPSPDAALVAVRALLHAEPTGVLVWVASDRLPGETIGPGLR